MPVHSLRAEVHEFIRAIEDLLCPDVVATHFTTEDCGIVGYYLMAMSGEWRPAPLMRHRLGMQLVRSEIAHFERAAQSLIAVAMLSACPLTEQEQVLVAYFVTRLQEEFVLPSD